MSASDRHRPQTPNTAPTSKSARRGATTNASARSERTRRKILDAAFDLVLRHGYTAATVDRILEKCGLTKGAFFHHFPSKADLTLALVERYIAEGRESLHSALIRAERHSPDPLEQLQYFHRDSMERAAEPAPARAPPAGCLIACAVYELEQHTPEARTMMRDFVVHYRRVLADKLREVMSRYPPRLPVSAEDLAEYLYATYDGGLVLGRLLNEPQALVRQLQHADDYLHLLFGRYAPPD